MRALNYFFLGVVVFLTSCAGNKDFVANQFLKDEFLKKIVSDSSYEVQIIYSRVNKKDKTFTTYTYNLDHNKYFYPASTVKMPVAILALQRLNEITRDSVEVRITDEMLTAAGRPGLTPAFIDTTNESRKPSIERYIQRIFAVSDNDSYNRLYEFLGQDYINETLQKKGVFTNSVINHRLALPGLSPEDNRYANNIRFFRDKKLVYDKPEMYAAKEWKHSARNSKKGMGYLDSRDSLISEPFDFSMKNFYSLKDMEGTLQRIILPDYFNESQRFDLNDDDYQFLRKSMSDLPKDFKMYKNNPAYYDSYVKFFMFGDKKEPMPDDIKIYNKVGTAYGYLIDCAYIENSSKNVGFFLTAVIHVNKNKIYNDSKYEYDEIGMPFLARLGRVVYAYEVKHAEK